MSSEEIKVESTCGAFNLLGAIFGEDPEKLKERHGLPTRARAREVKHTRACPS